MKITSHPDFREAVDSVISKDKTFSIVGHSLKAGQRARMHYHRKAKEWIIIGAGGFVLRTEKGDEKTRTELVPNINGNRLVSKKEDDSIVLAIHLDRKEKHSLEATSDISYLVLRNVKDRTIYVRKRRGKSGHR